MGKIIDCALVPYQFTILKLLLLRDVQHLGVDLIMIATDRLHLAGLVANLVQLSTRHLGDVFVSTTKSDEIVERIRRQLQAPDRSKQKRSDVDEMFVLDWNELFNVFARVFEIVVGFVIGMLVLIIRTPDIASSMMLRRC